MTAMAVHASQVSHVQLSWPRIGAWSGSLSLHLLIIALLLTPPVVLQVVRQVQKDPDVRFIVPEVIKPEPALPTVVRHQPVTPTKRTFATVAPPVVQQPPDISYVAPVTESPPAMESKPAIPDSAPSAITYGHKTQVPYPRESLINREQGTVILRVLVGADGVPQAVEIEKTSGFQRLDRAARDAVKGWSFHPAMHAGVASSAWALVPVTFNLQTL